MSSDRTLFSRGRFDRTLKGDSDRRMGMGFLTRIFGDGQAEQSRPPKPESEEKSKSWEQTRYEATVEYRNGEVETFECYGIYSRGEHAVKFNTDPYGRQHWHDGSAGYSYNRRKINYETLSREPTLEKVATDTFTLTWTVEYEWRTPRMSYMLSNRSWRGEPTDIELTVERDE